MNNDIFGTALVERVDARPQLLVRGDEREIVLLSFLLGESPGDGSSISVKWLLVARAQGGC